jgi:hypothetical protein
MVFSFMSERFKFQLVPWIVLYLVTSFEREAILLIGEKIVLPIQVDELEGLEVEIKIDDVGGAAVSEMDSGACRRGGSPQPERLRVHGNGYPRIVWSCRIHQIKKTCRSLDGHKASHVRVRRVYYEVKITPGIVILTVGVVKITGVIAAACGNGNASGVAGAVNRCRSFGVGVDFTQMSSLFYA